MTDEPITFGEPGSPETNKIRVELGKPFQCPCGCVMEHGDHWVAAHWGEKLTRLCPDCGQRFYTRGPHIKLVGKPYGTQPDNGW